MVLAKNSEMSATIYVRMWNIWLQYACSGGVLKCDEFKFCFTEKQAQPIVKTSSTQILYLSLVLGRKFLVFVYACVYDRVIVYIASVFGKCA